MHSFCKTISIKNDMYQQQSNIKNNISSLVTTLKDIQNQWVSTGNFRQAQHAKTKRHNLSQFLSTFDYEFELKIQQEQYLQKLQIQQQSLQQQRFVYTNRIYNTIQEIKQSQKELLKKQKQEKQELSEDFQYKSLMTDFKYNSKVLNLQNQLSKAIQLSEYNKAHKLKVILNKQRQQNRQQFLKQLCHKKKKQLEKLEKKHDKELQNFRKKHADIVNLNIFERNQRILRQTRKIINSKVNMEKIRNNSTRHNKSCYTHR